MSQKKKKRERSLEKTGQVKTIIDAALVKSLSWSGILRENVVFLVLMLLGVGALYANGMNANFVSDDYATISQNPDAGNVGHMIRTLNLMGIFNAGLAAIFGVSSPLPFHLFSLGLYLITLVLGFVLIYLLAGKRTAVIASIIFAVMPVHVEAVTWISGKPYLFNALFVLLSFIYFVMYRKTGVKKYWYIFLLTLPVTFLAERVRSLALAFIIPLYFLAFEPETLRNINWTKYVLPALGVVLVVGVILWPSIQGRIMAVNSGYNASGGIFYNPFFQYPTAIPKYLQLVVFPTDLTLYHTMYVLPSWLNWSILLVFLATVVYFFFADKRYFFALAFIFAATAPSMAPVKVSWLVAERYIFLGSLGVAMLLGLLGSQLWDKWKYVTVVGLAILLPAYTMRVFIRNIDWQTNHNLWVNTVQVSPNSHNAWNNIGDDYDKLQQYEHAIKGFTQSTRVKENYADAYHNRANILYKIGRLDLARDSYYTALKYSPTLFQTYLSLVQVDLMEKKIDLAYQHASKAVEIQPNNPQSYFAMGVVLANAGQRDNAIMAVKKSLELAPNYKMAQDVLVQLEAMPPGSGNGASNPSQGQPQAPKQ